MKSIFAAVLILGVLPLANATDKQGQPYSKGTVIKVERYEAPPMASGSNPSDAPLPDPETYDYDVSVKVNCGTYVGRYETWYNYVPSVLAPNQKVQLRMTHGEMYVDVPNQKEVEMRIVSRHKEHGPCDQNNQSVAAGLVAKQR